MVVSISTQGSMKYEIYRSIEHGNVFEQQMPGIHVHDQIYMYGHIHINLFTNHYQKVGFHHDHTTQWKTGFTICVTLSKFVPKPDVFVRFYNSFSADNLNGFSAGTPM